MVHGHSEIDLHGADVARFHDCQRTLAHVKARASEGFNKTYGIVHPSEQWASNRNVRLSPFHAREQELGAVFYEVAGWERPQWYESNAGLVSEYGVEPRAAEWDARWWSPIINAEHLAMRERAGIFDLSAFCIFDVTGPGALDAVQGIAMRQCNVAVGRVVYTPILSPAGGFKADLTIMRLAEDRFRVVTGGAHGMGDIKWFRDHLPADGSAQISDLTSAWTTIGLWGPRARDILSSVTSDDVSNEGFALRHRAGHRDRPAAGAGLADLLRGRPRLGAVRPDRAGRPAVGPPLGGRPAAPPGAAGIGVYGTTGRLEKGYRAFGAELDAEYDVVEAGMAWGKVKDQDFVGKEAHVAQRDADPAAVMCTLTVDDHADETGTRRFMLGREPVLSLDGAPLVDAKGRRSFVTSAGAGPSVGRYLLMSYLPPEHAKKGEKLLVEYLGHRYPVTVAVAGSTPLFDPENGRVRS